MNNLERIRKERKLTQIKLAEKCEITQGMVSEYENGTLPSLPIALRIAKILRVSVETLWPVNAKKPKAA